MNRVCGVVINILSTAQGERDGDNGRGCKERRGGKPYSVPGAAMDSEWSTALGKAAEGQEKLHVKGDTVADTQLIITGADPQCQPLQFTLTWTTTPRNDLCFVPLS